MIKIAIFLLLFCTAFTFSYSNNYKNPALESKIKSTDTITNMPQKDVLVAIYKSNPENTLEWNLNEQDISNWQGVTTNKKGDVIGLDK